MFGHVLMLVLFGHAAAADMVASPAAAPATRLRVEYLERPISIDTAKPRFSFALPAETKRGTVQKAYRLIVSTAPAVGKPAVVWDSGAVHSNRTLNIPYGGAPRSSAAAAPTAAGAAAATEPAGAAMPPRGGAPAAALKSDTDYSWSVTWTDAHGVASAPAIGTFSVAILSDDTSNADWHGANWVSSVANGSLSTYRAAFNLPAAPVRARLYFVGLGYAKTWINGNLSDTHELGQYVTFQERVLYDCVDVSSHLVQVTAQAPHHNLISTDGFLRDCLWVQGENVLGMMLGNGWFSQVSVNHGPRQFLLLLSATAHDGTTSYFHSATAGQSASEV